MQYLLSIAWDVNPTIFSLGPLHLRWYSILFTSGLMLCGPWIVWKMWKKESLPEKWFESLFWYTVIGTIVGARLGHCLFYDPAYYLDNPHKIIATWEGGFASHGGTIGLIIALWIYSRKVTHKSILWGMDRLSVPIGLVAAMIRIGNLMNSEIFGHPTDLPWAFRFIRSQEYLALNTTLGCHPTAIYEALAYFLIFTLCMWMYWKKKVIERYDGMIVGVLLTGIFSARFFIEKYKMVQEVWELDLIDKIGVNMGQLLSIPFVVLGVVIVVYALKHPLQKNK